MRIYKRKADFTPEAWAAHAAVRKIHQARYIAKDPEKYRAMRAAFRHSDRGRAIHNRTRTLRHQQSAMTGPSFAERLTGNALFGAIAAHVPTQLPADIRDDVMMEITLAVLENRVDLAEVKLTVRKFISAHFKAREWYTLSLDAPTMDTRTLLEKLPSTAGMWQ